MTIYSIGHSLKSFGGIGLWGLSACMAILLHGTGMLYFSGSSTGATAPGVGGIDIGLGPSGRLAGNTEQVESGEDQVSSREEEGDGKPLPTHVPTKKNIVVQKQKPAEQIRQVFQENTLSQIKKDDRPEENNVDDTVVKTETIAEHQPEIGTGPSAKAQLQARGAGGLSGFGGQDQTGIGNGSSGGGSKGDVAGYYIRLQKWIQDHQNYPSKARRLKQQGVTMVKLGITAQGKLLFARVVRSSGFPLLDKAALEAIRNSAPLLPIPKHFHKDMITLVIPMQFILT